MRMTKSRETMIAQMRNAGKGYGEIADYLGLRKSTVKSWCTRHGFSGTRVIQKKKEKAEKPAREVFCRRCGKPVIPNDLGRPRIFCSSECRITYWKENTFLIKRSQESFRAYKCANCGRQFKVYGTARRKYCSHECYINLRYYRSAI